jgi:NAD(P)-dependent dehydrogenase (short-subunit alcohol dehydrogenase family)
MRIAVIDGQGGGIGKSLVEKIKIRFGNQVHVIALGTNAVATSLMIRAGADDGASGENAIVVNVGQVDLIVGTVGIISANSMLGELTPAMAKAISSSPAKKVLIPLNRCNIMVTGVANTGMPEHIDEVIESIRQLL